MTDPELDRALADALDVEPRPDFLARVRTEIARQPEPAAAWPAWWHAAAAAAMLAIAIVTVYRIGVEDQAVVTESARTAAPLVATRSEPVPPAVRQIPSVPSPPVQRSAVRTTPSALPAPQISPEDANVLRLTMDGAGAGLFAPIAARDASVPLVVSGIELSPIEVMPLAQMAIVDSGERQ